MAEGLGYRTNPLAAAFMAHLRGARPPKYKATIAFLVQDERTLSERSGYRDDVQSSSEAAARSGYSVEVVPITLGSSSRSSTTKILFSRGIVGLILSSWRDSDPPLDIDWSHFAIVSMGDRLFKPPIDVVRNDHVHTMHLMFRELRKLGYSRIGLHMKKLLDDWTEHRYTAAYLWNCQQSPTRSRMKPCITPTLEKAAFLKWLKEQQPDVVVSGHIEALGWMQEIGIRVPEDVGFAHQSVFAEFQECTGVDQRNRQLVSAAVEMIISQLHMNLRGLPRNPRSILLEGVWNPGTTTRQVSGD